MKTPWYRPFWEGGPRTLAAVAAMFGLAIGSAFLLPRSSPPKPNTPSDGSVAWKATGFRLDNGYGINLEGFGTPVQIYPGSSADLEVDGVYLSSGGKIAFLPPGKSPTYQNCLSALGSASGQLEPLNAALPGRHADLCSSGSFGNIAYVHVTRNDQSSLTMNITVWNH
jgi:hypothetical protein